MKRILVVLALLAAAVGAFAASANTTQLVNITIAEVCAIRIDPSGAISLGTVAPTPGDPVSGSSDNSTYLQYTTATSGAALWISARLNAVMPGGTDLTLVSAAIASGGGGSRGTPQPVVTLTTSDQTIINAISQGCFTGSASGNGARLTYTLVITGAPTPAVTSRTVTLTLTDT